MDNPTCFIVSYGLWNGMDCWIGLPTGVDKSGVHWTIPPVPYYGLWNGMDCWIGLPNGVDKSAGVEEWSPLKSGVHWTIPLVP